MATAHWQQTLSPLKTNNITAILQAASSTVTGDGPGSTPSRRRIRRAIWSTAEIRRRGDGRSDRDVKTDVLWNARFDIEWWWMITIAIIMNDLFQGFYHSYSFIYRFDNLIIGIYSSSSPRTLGEIYHWYLYLLQARFRWLMNACIVCSLFYLCSNKSVFNLLSKDEVRFLL